MKILTPAQRVMLADYYRWLRENGAPLDDPTVRWPFRVVASALDLADKLRKLGAL